MQSGQSRKREGVCLTDAFVCKSFVDFSAHGIGVPKREYNADGGHALQTIWQHKEINVGIDGKTPPATRTQLDVIPALHRVPLRTEP